MKFNKRKKQLKVPEGLAFKANNMGILNEVANYYKLKAFSEDGFFSYKTYSTTLAPLFECKPTSVNKIINKLVKLGFVRKDFNGYSVISLDKLRKLLGYDMTVYTLKNEKTRRGTEKIHKEAIIFFIDNFRDGIEALDLRSNPQAQKRAIKAKLGLNSKDKDTVPANLKGGIFNRNNTTFTSRLNKLVEDNIVQIVKLNDQDKIIYDLQEAMGKGDKVGCNFDITLSVRGVNRILGHKSLSTTFSLLRRLEKNGRTKVKRRSFFHCECDSYFTFLSLNLDRRYYRFNLASKSVIRVISNKVSFI